MVAVPADQSDEIIEKLHGADLNDAAIIGTVVEREGDVGIVVV